jgi:Domain of unknown function (DUF4360)
MIKQTLFLTFLVVGSSFASSKTVIIDDTPIEIGDIVANGAGCPDGTVAASATDDNTQVAVLFSMYKAITNNIDTLAVSDCNIAIPLTVGPGFSVGIVDIDWRGTVISAPGAFVNFHREFFFSGNGGPFNDTEWASAGFENFLLNDRPTFVHYSDCDGSALIARADTSATVSGANSLFSLRSADISAELLLTLQVHPC